MFNKLKLFIVTVFAMAFGFAATSAHAAIDIAGVLLGITDAGTAILAVIGALLALSVSLFGIVKVYRFVSSKAGA
jgi:Inovirus Coat protein B